MKRLLPPTAVPVLVALPALAFLAVSFKGMALLGAIMLLAGLIFIHELGHFLAAKYMGMPVKTFSLGFPPRLIGFKWGETDVCLSAIPLGGYVSLLGYNPEEPDAEDPHGFLKQPAWKRLLFYTGGVLFNVLAAWIALSAVNAHYNRVTRIEVHHVVGVVEKGSPAQKGGLQKGDELVSVGGLAVASSDWETTVVPMIRQQAGQPVRLHILREGKALDLDLVPAGKPGEGRLGLYKGSMEVPVEFRPLGFKDVARGLAQGASDTWRQGWAILKGLGHLFVGKAKVTDMGGPGTIATMAYRAAESGWISYMAFFAFISLNLAVLNALPIPFLDGGHVAILLFERVRRKDLAPATKLRILNTGLYFIIGLMLLVILLDVKRFIG